MSQPETLRALAEDGGPARAVVVPPAPRLRDAPVHLVRRAIGAIRAMRISRPAERISWPPGRAGEGWLEDIRALLLGGAVRAELSRHSAVQSVRDDRRFTPTDTMRIGAGGTLSQIGLIGHSRVVTRFGVVGGSSDPGWHYSALTELRCEPVPEPLGTGIQHGVRWTIERFVPGTGVRELTENVVTETSRFLASLPMPAGNIRSLDDAAERLERLDVAGFDVGEHRRRLQPLIDRLPAVVAHGDMWLGNLLFDGDRLTGVLDWDSWARHGVPGSDILHLFAEYERRRRRCSYGALVQARFWENPDASAALRAHLSEVGADASSVPSGLIAEAWWLEAIDGALSRVPDLVGNRAWLSENVLGPSRWFSPPV